MRKALKKLMYSPLVLAALFVAAIGVTPASLLSGYQPAPPRQ
ncbi:MAG: AgrD family cyclic lactone autoinducer peptide [Bacillota bacterium]